MNFNSSTQPEYDLYTSVTNELINLYGILVKFLVTEKINFDSTFGDYSHLKSDSNKIYDIYMLPEMTEDWDSNNYGFQNFGLTNFENVVLFAMKSKFEEIDEDIKNIIGNLIVLPNNKVMEITDIDLTVPGVNNLFTYNDAKSVYKLTCKPYDFKLINELDSVDISVEDNVPYDTLDTYFNELIDQATEQDNYAEINASVSTVIKNDDASADIITNKPIVDNSEDSVFGKF